MHGLLISLFLLCVAWSALMSGMEAGVFALNRLRIRHLMHEGDPRARTLYSYLENTENFLWTILVGSTLANFGVASIGVWWLFAALWQRPWWLFAALVGGILAFYAVCELLPKMLFRLRPNRECLAFVGLFRLADLALKPLVAPMSWFAQTVLRWTGGHRFTGLLFGNRDELRLVMQESAQSLTSEERRMINRVLDLQNLAVRTITTPMGRAVAVESQTPLAEVLRLGRDRSVNRLPVWGGEGPQRRVVGLLALRPLLYEEGLDLTRKASEFMKPVLYLDEGMRLEVALTQLQRRGQRLAVVLDRERRELGIVSLEDILKVIFGEVRF